MSRRIPYPGFALQLVVLHLPAGLKGLLLRLLGLLIQEERGNFHYLD
jgi:hypothetical protein